LVDNIVFCVLVSVSFGVEIGRRFAIIYHSTYVIPIYYSVNASPLGRNIFQDGILHYTILLSPIVILHPPKF
jgi:hypothetical protein